MRLALEICGQILTFTWDKVEPEPPPREPDPQGSTCGDLERAERWDHDQRVPVGFRAKENA